jgi:hypothetical protein
VIWLIRQMIMQHGTVEGLATYAATTDKVLPRIPSGKCSWTGLFSTGKGAAGGKSKF